MMVMMMGMPIVMVMVLVIMVVGVPIAMVVVRVVMVVMQIIVMVRRHGGTDGGGAVERMQEGDEGAALHPQQPHPDHDNERVADDFDHIYPATHGRRGGAQQRGPDSDDGHRAEGLPR